MKFFLVQNYAIFYCFGVFELIWPHPSITTLSTAVVFLITAAWAQRQRPLTLFLRRFQDPFVDKFLMEAIRTIEPMTRTIWIKNDKNKVIPSMLPLALSAKVYIVIFWPTIAIISIYQLYESWDSATLTFLYTITTAWLLLATFSGYSAKNILAFISSCILALSFKVVTKETSLIVDYDDTFVMFFLATTTIPLSFVLQSPIQKLGNICNLPFFSDYYITEKNDINQLARELENSKKGFPFLGNRYILNAPVLGYQIPCNNQVWEETVLHIIPFVDVAIIDITGLSRFCGVEKEIESCLSKNTPLLITCKSDCFDESEEYMHRLSGERLYPIIKWDINVTGEIKFNKSNLQDHLWFILQHQ